MVSGLALHDPPSLDTATPPNLKLRLVARRTSTASANAS
jgi:hypothetical protein